MKLDATPAIDGAVEQALVGVLGESGVASASSPSLYGDAWRRAGLLEGIEGEESAEPFGYALSPRSTRGATRA